MMKDENVLIFNNLYAKNPRHNSLKVCVCIPKLRVKGLLVIYFLIKALT